MVVSQLSLQGVPGKPRTAAFVPPPLTPSNPCSKLSLLGVPGKFFVSTGGASPSTPSVGRGAYPLLVLKKAERKKRRRKILKVLRVVKNKPKVEVDHNQVRALTKALENEDHQKLLAQLISDEFTESREQIALYQQILAEVAEEEATKRLFLERTLARLEQDAKEREAQLMADWLEALEVVRQAHIRRRQEEADDEMAWILLQ